MVLVYAIAILVFTSVSPARTWYITPDGTGDVPTIQAGVDSAARGDTLLLADGTYRGPGNRDVTGDKRLIIRSESDDPEACIIDCEGSSASPHRAFHISRTGGQSELSGLSVVNGWAYERGGAIFVDVSRADIRNCMFRDNFGGEGGAVFVCGGPSLISECAFIGNSAYDGGAVEAYCWTTTLIIERSLFVRNSAPHGGGAIGIEDGSNDPWIFVEINNCTMVDNSGIFSAVASWDTDCGCEIRNSIIAYGTGGYQPVTLPDCGVQCTAFYENQPYPDWLPAGDGNFLGCPSFCDLATDDFHLCNESPCAPGNHPDSVNCGLIGALDVGCVCGPSATEPTTWGAIKSIYR
jgi:hypothetical protein